MSKRKPARKRHQPKGKPVTIRQPQWDQGAAGPANRERLHEEPATDIDPETGRETPNPNGIRRQRRQTWVTIYAAKGQITKEQAAAGDALLLAAEGMNEKDPLAALAGRVQSSPASPETARVDARRAFWKMWDKIPKSSKPIVERVVLNDQPVWAHPAHGQDAHFKRLQDGLEALR